MLEGGLHGSGTAECFGAYLEPVTIEGGAYPPAVGHVVIGDHDPDGRLCGLFYVTHTGESLAVAALPLQAVKGLH